jgi:indolepyruvate ferredoxin oxidoreductase alpha subunit
MKHIMLGNEAIGRGFIEGGVQVAVGYPGTPSTEILQYIIDNAGEYGIYTEWSVNEKVAMEVAIAGSVAGVRSLVTMKSVGLNVASDPINAYAYMGVRGGMVIVSADDPSCHSTHTEQDSRYHAKLAYLPVFEPSNPGEGKDMASVAFEYSERWEQPVLFRTTTRIGHSRYPVVWKGRNNGDRVPEFIRDLTKYVNLPQNARRMRQELVERMEKIKKDINNLEFNRVEGDGSIGIVASGISYGYVKEAVDKLDIECRILKISTPYPLPEEMVVQFLEDLERVLVVEEVEPIVEEGIIKIANKHGFSIPIYGKEFVPLTGELSPDIAYNSIARFLERPEKDLSKFEEMVNRISEFIPPRPPVLCPGCPHRTAFYSINRVEKKLFKKERNIVKPSDIGCYTLGYQPPLSAVDTNFCMGASVGVASGLSKLIEKPVVATIGDSTFFHAGIPPLLNMVFNRAKATVIILDNRTTAMTGHQPHPGVGKNVRGEKVPPIIVEEIVKACGVDFVRVVDAFDVKTFEETLREAVEYDGVAVIVSKGPCALLDVRDKIRAGETIPVYYVSDDCTGCKSCLNLGCPAITFDEKAGIEETLCVGCSVCAQVCPVNAIKVVE